MSENSIIELDGSQGEGGGQILRSALALSLLTGRPFRLHNIRARRPKPGLAAQHLMSVQAAARVGQAEVRGAGLGSCELSFTPGPVVPGHYSFEIGTAGATALVLHTVYLPLALRGGQPSHLSITGGSHVMAAPSFEFLHTTWRGYLGLMGLPVSLTLRRPGFYPRGGGLLESMIPPIEKLTGLTLEPARPTRIDGVSAVADLPEHISRRQAQRAEELIEGLPWPVSIERAKWQNGPASVLTFTIHGGRVPTVIFGLGEKGKSAEDVAADTVAELQRYLDAETMPVDPHAADQLLLPAVFAEGPTSYAVSEVTQHLLTNRDVIAAFLDRTVTITGNEGEPGRVEVA